MKLRGTTRRVLDMKLDDAATVIDMYHRIELKYFLRVLLYQHKLSKLTD